MLPLPRFKTGDIVTLTSKECVCGFLSRRILQISGREYNNFYVDLNTPITPSCFNNNFFNEFREILEFRLIQESSMSFRLELDVGGEQVHDSLIRRVRAWAVMELGQHVNLEVSVNNNLRQDPLFERYVIREP